METIVIRGDGDKEGPAIIDSLLTTTQARQERGRVDIDYNCSSRTSREIRSFDLSWIPPGSFVEIEDVEKGRVPGIVKAISLSMGSDGSIVKILRVETEAE